MDTMQGSVWLPMGAGESLRVQGGKGPPGERVGVKNLSPGELVGALLPTMQQAALQVRASQPQQFVGPRSVRLYVQHMAPVGALLGCPMDLFLAWSAAAAALADRLARGGVSDWGDHTLLLAELDLQEALPERWGSLKPLQPELESLVLRTLESGRLSNCWKQATVVLAGGGTDQSALREALTAQLPDSRVLVVDTLATLHGAHDVVRRPGVGEAWFPVVGAVATHLHRLQVAVWPWQHHESEESPIDVVETPLDTSASLNKDLGRQITGMLRAWRRQEQPSQRLWHTVVSVPPDLKRVAGDSFQLALVMADRIARGREWPGHGRVLATGAVCMDMGSRCKVLDVGDADSKLRAFWSQARAGDTVLLPQLPAWQERVKALQRARLSPSPMTQGLVNTVLVAHAIP